jgi:hypothetical protein
MLRRALHTQTRNPRVPFVSKGTGVPIRAFAFVQVNQLKIGFTRRNNHYCSKRSALLPRDGDAQTEQMTQCLWTIWGERELHTVPTSERTCRMTGARVEDGRY